jgi:hypothetical protein
MFAIIIEWAEASSSDNVWLLILPPRPSPFLQRQTLRHVPIHMHLVEQDCSTSRSGGRSASRCSTSPHAPAAGRTPIRKQKVGERLGEGVRESLKITEVQPNHGWRHLWREIMRGTALIAASLVEINHSLTMRSPNVNDWGSPCRPMRRDRS